MRYEICIPPLKKPFCKMTHKETEAYFNWHLSHLNERIEYLSTVAATQLGIPTVDFDLSPQSLILLWSWFLSVAQIERTPTKSLKELEKQFNSQPELFKQYLLDQSRDQFSLETEYILRDIGMYLGEVFVKNEPGIMWAYYEKPKTDFFVNMPVLSGFEDNSFTPPFKMYFEPSHMAKVQAAKIWDGSQQKEDLYNIYCKWAGSFVPQKP